MNNQSDSGRARLIWSCTYCGTVLAIWRMRCTNCQKRALSWLHVAAIGVVVLPAVLYFLRIV